MSSCLTPAAIYLSHSHDSHNSGESLTLLMADNDSINQALLPCIACHGNCCEIPVHNPVNRISLIGRQLQKHTLPVVVFHFFAFLASIFIIRFKVFALFLIKAL